MKSFLAVKASWDFQAFPNTASCILKQEQILKLISHLARENNNKPVSRGKTADYQVDIDSLSLSQITVISNNLVPIYFFLNICLFSRDQGEVLAEALKIMLCDDRQHDMQKAAAFVKRLATFSLCFGCAESMSGM